MVKKVSRSFMKPKDTNEASQTNENKNLDID